MDSKLREFLDKIYELEGLVHLALSREDETGRLLNLIARKGKEIGNYSDSLTNGSFMDSKKNEEPSEAFNFVEYSLDEETESPEEDDAKEMTDENRGIQRESRKGKLVFSINDRFRFRKELFGNSDADFNNSLALVASMEDYEEAENYFVNDEGFEKANPVVSEFLEIIKRYFK